MTPAQEPPSSRGIRTRRFRFRSGLDVPFTRLGATIAEIGVVADAGGYATLVEIIRLGEGTGDAKHVLWHVNPSKRQVSPLPTAKAEEMLRGAPFRIRCSRSKLLVGGHRMELVEFERPVEDGPFVLIELQPGEQLTPPVWATEEVTHDPKTEIMQVVLDAWHKREAEQGG